MLVNRIRARWTRILTWWSRPTGYATVGMVREAQGLVQDLIDIVRTEQQTREMMQSRIDALQEQAGGLEAEVRNLNQQMAELCLARIRDREAAASAVKRTVAITMPRLEAAVSAHPRA